MDTRRRLETSLCRSLQLDFPALANNKTKNTNDHQTKYYINVNEDK